MARYPTPGRVKTRLAAAFGAELACAFYRAFVLDLAERLSEMSLPVTWAYCPPEAPFASLVPGGRCRVQEGRTLGDRMAAAVAAELGDGAGAVIVLGADVPHVPAEALAEGADALARGTDVVLGPAVDGGYYLIGLRAPLPFLFEGIAWGTATVLDATLARAAAAGLRTRLLARGFDVDDVADVTRLRGLMASGAVRLPRTAALLGARNMVGSP